MIRTKHIVYNLIKKLYSLLLTVITGLFGIECAKIIDARIRFGRTLDLKTPQTLADKVSYISLFTLPELAVRCTDKWEVRKYVTEKGFADILIPVFGNAVSKADDIDFSQLPEKFVLKATHGCKMNYICTDRAAFDEKAVRKELRNWLRTTYGTFSVEPHYKKLQHRVYCEKLIAPSDELVDYKFFCCNGVPTAILVCSGRSDSEACRSKLQMKLYDVDWERIDGLKNTGNHLETAYDFKKPENFAQMLTIAESLSADFDFVRVDLYNLQGKIYFGELTFTPANGVFESYTDDFIAQMGKRLTITRKETAV